MPTELGRFDAGAAHVARSRLRVLKGDFSAAMPEFDAAIRLAPSSSYAFVQRGHAFRQAGQPARALAGYRQAVRLEPALEKDSFVAACRAAEAAAGAAFTPAIEASKSWPRPLAATPDRRVGRRRSDRAPPS